MNDVVSIYFHTHNSKNRILLVYTEVGGLFVTTELRGYELDFDYMSLLMT